LHSDFAWSAHFCEELIGEDADVRLFQPGGAEHVDDFLRRDRTIVIRVQRFLEHLGEFAALDEVSL